MRDALCNRIQLRRRVQNVAFCSAKELGEPQATVTKTKYLSKNNVAGRSVVSDIGKHDVALGQVLTGAKRLERKSSTTLGRTILSVDEHFNGQDCPFYERCEPCPISGREFVWAME